MQQFEFIAPSSLAEVLELLERHGDGCRVVAGGTDIMPALRNGRLSCVTRLVDIRRRQELRGIKITGDGLWIGAATTHSEVVQSPDVRARWPLLAEACGRIGSKQIRNLATVGGNVANASPAADSVPALLCLDARISLLSGHGKRELPLQSYLAERKRNAPAELVEGFTLPFPLANTYSKFVKVSRRQAMAISRLSLAMALHVDGGVIDFVRIVPGAMLAVPQHLERVEEYLVGRELTEDAGTEAARLTADVVTGITGMRPSFKYKLTVLEGLVRQVLAQFRDGGADHG
jgi:CO/xanthine dehydrogenase FAD-binding subunit